jgi:hypothetical protein
MGTPSRRLLSCGHVANYHPPLTAAFGVYTDPAPLPSAKRGDFDIFDLGVLDGLGQAPSVISETQAYITFLEPSAQKEQCLVGY